MIVVEIAPNPEAAAVASAGSSCHFPYTQDSQLLTAAIWRGDKHFNANVASDPRTSCAADQRAVQRNIVGKAAFRKLAAIIPVKDDGEMQPVAHSGAALRCALKDKKVLHTYR